MSCSCNCNPCSCSPRPAFCCTPTTESVEYTFENGNVTGIGVFDNETDNLVQFRGIVSDSAALTVTLDPADVAIVLSFDQDALVADIPDADTTTRGILETATNAEAIAKAATNKILVPSNLAAIGASDTFAGLVELATDAETQAGISTTLAVTPAGLASTYALLPGQQEFADAVARGAAVPDKQGQIGFQVDTDIPYVGYNTVAGAWFPFFIFGSANNAIENVTTVTLSGATSLNFDDATTGSFVNFDCGVTFDAGRFTYFSSNNVEFSLSAINIASSTVKLNGVLIPGQSVVLTSGIDGDLSSGLISDFLSIYNLQTGWGTPSSTLDRTTFATYAGQTISNPPTQAEVQAIDDALVIVSQHLGALITDLKAKLLPAT
jgi:hypothetical protein